MIGYLAGGMRSGWQDAVMAAPPAIDWRDPRTHALTDERAYTAWDVTAIIDADLVFAYMEIDNPGGQGLALEIGLAAGLNAAMGAICGEKTIILVDPGHHRYLGMARALATTVCATLEEGIREAARLRETS